MLFTPQKHKKYNKATDSEKNSRVSTNVCDNQRKQLKEYGILLVQGLDPISRLFSYITRQQYTLIGTYSQYVDLEYEQININYIFNGDKPIWMSDIKTLQELELSSGINKIVKYPFNKSIDIDIELADWAYSTRPLLISLFKHDFIEMVGIKRIIGNLYPYSSPPSVDNEVSPIETLIKKSPVISSDIITIDCNTNRNIDNNFKPDRPYLSKIIATFIDMILSDFDFLTLVAENYFTKVHSYDLLHELVLQHLDIHDATVLLIKEWISNGGKIDKDSINRLIDKINKISNNEYPTIEEIPPDLIVVDKTPSPTIVQSVKTIKQQLTQIVTMLQQKDVPYIELNTMIRTVNYLSDYYQLGEKIPIINKPSSGLLIISPHEDISIALTLKSGDKVLLTTRNFNLSIFTRSELIEILEGIDKLVIDDRYDTLRARITKEIIEYES